MEQKQVCEWLVPDMVCEGCVQAIQRLLNGLAGVEQVTAQLDTRRVRVLFDSAQVQETTIQQHIIAAGFSPQLVSPAEGE
ncbi:MAG: heavy-metal-associated domain-containing protein [Armatimonadota bacterium]